MACLALKLLGPFQATLDGQAVEFATDKVRALLAYLAVESDRPHPRESLAGLLWPDYAETSARQSLTQALFSLRTALGDRAAGDRAKGDLPQATTRRSQRSCALCPAWCSSTARATTGWMSPRSARISRRFESCRRPKA